MITPKRLESLWDMLNLSLYELVTSMTNVKAIGQTIRQSIRAGVPIPPPSAEELRFLLDSCEVLDSTCLQIDMPVTASLARHLSQLLNVHGIAFGNDNHASRSIGEVCDRLENEFRAECKERVSMVIATSRACLFRQDEPLFGTPVSLKFAKVSGDISEAGKCLALERPTACVFHLMRAVEYAVQRLGKKLHVAVDVDREGWYQITIHINKAVDALPSGSARQRKVKQEYGAAAAHLNSVRIATRNDVMHPKATYTDEEAQTLFDATKALMQQMAKII